jgi:hypothetical protein
VPLNPRKSLAVRCHLSGKNVLKKSIFFFIEEMDLFITLNVATFKNIRFIPIIICKYFFFFCIHGNKAMLLKNVVSQSRTGLHIYEGHNDQLNRPGLNVTSESRDRI